MMIPSKSQRINSSSSSVLLMRSVDGTRSFGLLFDGMSQGTKVTYTDEWNALNTAAVLTLNPLSTSFTDIVSYRLIRTNKSTPMEISGSKWQMPSAWYLW
jgi:hypothetical protein